MSMPRYNAKRDYAEKEVVRTLQELGFSVWRLDQPVDLLIGFRGDIWLAEVKTGRAKFNDNQVKFMAEWRGRPVIKLTSSQDAIDFAISVTEK
jgi:Holliday junction resolvase